MREIIFRGKRKDNGEWIEGALYQISTDLPPFIMLINKHAESHEVIHETVGQYTGMTDKNGVEIFEGDICRNSRNGEIVSVKWHGTMAGFVWSKRKEGTCLYDFGELFRAHDKYEVIGNIRDDPELLEVGGDG